MTACALLGAAFACAADAPLSGIERVEIKVRDRVQSERFYSEVLGFGKGSGSSFRVNERQSIEIVSGRADAADHHVAAFSLATSNIKGASELLRRRGVKTSEIQRVRDGSLQFTLRDVDGNRIVIVQPAAGVHGNAVDTRGLSARLRHVGIHVADLDAAAKFYREKLDLVAEDLQRGKTRWINMQLPGGDFIQMQTAPESAPSERRWVHEHFGLDVADAHATYAALLRRGVAPRPAFEPVVGYAGHLKINFLDPDNMLIEFMELGTPKASERREQ